MLWYLLRTWTGKEEELVKEIRRTVPPHMYNEAFVIYSERIWRRQGRSIVHADPMFPGCAFLTCNETQPLFRRLEQIPAMSRLMAMGYLAMFPLQECDARFLEEISGEDHVVRLSQVLKENTTNEDQKSTDRLKEQTDSDGENCSVRINDVTNKTEIVSYRISGPLTNFLTGVESIDFKKRFVKLRRTLWGEDMVLALGIVLNEDVEEKIRLYNLDVSVEMNGQYQIMEIRKDQEGKKTYTLAGT